MDFELVDTEDSACAIRGRIIVGWFDGPYMDGIMLSVVGSFDVGPDLLGDQLELALADALRPHAVQDGWVRGRHDGFRTGLVLAHPGPEGPHNMYAIYLPDVRGRIQLDATVAPESDEPTSIVAYVYGYASAARGIALRPANPTLSFHREDPEHGIILQWDPADRRRWMGWVGFTPVEAHRVNDLVHS